MAPVRPYMTVHTFPPNYTDVYAQRQKRLVAMRENPALILGAKEFYKTRPIEFIEDWCITYDPRNAGHDTLPTHMPFMLFPKQKEFIQFLYECLRDTQPGLVEKSRDMGATWVCVAFSVWLWIFWPGSSVGWGSRDQDLVDEIGNPDSIFEKVRILVRDLPREFIPKGFVPKAHAVFMKLINPETGATITGDCGDNIGRGGRSLIYFKDESAHYQHPELVEAALSANARVQIDISSVNGTGNVFHRRREAGQEWVPGAEIPKGTTRVFIMDWRDSPFHTQEWYDLKKKEFSNNGLEHIFAQEVDRNYAAAVSGIIILSKWVEACVDADKKLGFDDSGRWMGSLDVADGGGDTNAHGKRKGVVLKYLDEWGARDTGETTRKTVDSCEEHPDIEVQYDCIGVGAGVKSEVNRLIDENKMPRSIKFVAWNAGAKCLNPDKHMLTLPNGLPDKASPINEDYFANLKAQGWFELARRCERTYRAVTEGMNYTWNPNDLISFDSSTIPPHFLRKLKKELSQPVRKKESGRMRMIVDKVPDGTKSPNLADCVMQLYWPVTTGSYSIDDLAKAI